MENKKGAEMTIGTIIIIILALVVLVFLIFGFTQGWGNLRDKLFNWGGGQSNVQTIVQACSIACSTQSAYDYNTLTREVKFSATDSVTGVTCDDLQKGFCIKDKAKAVAPNQTACEDVAFNVNGTWKSAVISPVCTI